MSDTVEKYQALQRKAEQLKGQVARHEGTMERILSELKEVGSENGEKFTTVKDAQKWLQKQQKAVEKDRLKLEKLIVAFEEKWAEQL